MKKTFMHHAKIRKLFPFLLIFLVVVIAVERRKSVPLSPPQMKLIHQEMRAAENTDFTLPDLSETPTSLGDFKGKVVLLNFFATWCPPCREEMPTIEGLFQTYKHEDFVVLGVAGDVKGKEVVEPFVQKFNMTFPVVLDSTNRVSEQYQVRGIPTIYLFDRQGRIAGTLVGGADWNSQKAHELIEQLLQET